MSWAAIWAVPNGLFRALNEAGRWRLTIDGAPSDPVTEVRVHPGRIRFGFRAGAGEMILEAALENPARATVRVNGEVDQDARFLFSLRPPGRPREGDPPRAPLVAVVEFRNVTAGGEKRWYRFDTAA